MRYRLHWSPTSPYVRKVMVVAHELRLADRFELVPTRPETVVADVSRDNPLGRIPVLVVPDGTALFDSLVIAEYLDHAGGGGLFPPPGPARWRTLTLHALAQGIIDAAIVVVSERRRPSAERSDAFLNGRFREIGRALDALEQGILDAAVTIGTITLAVGLGYVDFRLPALGWRRERPKLSGWYDGFSARPSMQATNPIEVEP